MYKRQVNIINFVMDKPMDFSGTYVFFAAVVYALQLYADFSGGIDIVRGIDVYKRQSGYR